MKNTNIIESTLNTNKAQMIVIKKGSENLTTSEWDLINSSVTKTLNLINENKEEFINSYGNDWYEYIIEDTHVALFEFGESLQ